MTTFMKTARWNNYSIEKACLGNISRASFLSIVAMGFLVGDIACGASKIKEQGDTATTIKVSPTPSRIWHFAEDGIAFDSRFPGARLNDCTRKSAGEYRLITQPENRPINPSAWFAFKVTAETARQVIVYLECADASVRYRPKISVDGLNWVTLPAEAFEIGTNKNSATLRLEVAPEPLWVAAQEMVGVERLTAWSRTLERLPFVTRAEIGRTSLGKPIDKLEITGAKNPASIVIIGRQHPPEVTGSLALMRFVETLTSDTPLARSFRAEFNVLVVPLLNPDGVEQGHWRHNMNGVDINRDWANFRQPETRAVRDEVLALRTKSRIFLHLDFHSTFHDVFYTQSDEESSSLIGFTKPWIEGIQKRFPDYKAQRIINHLSTANTSHNWAHRTLGIPAITYEIGDNTDRALLQQIATGAAEEMMTLLLDLKRQGSTMTP